MKIFRKLKKFVKNRGKKKLIQANAVRDTLNEERRVGRDVKAIIDEQKKTVAEKIAEGSKKTIQQQAEIYNDSLTEIRLNCQSNINNIKENYEKLRSDDQARIMQKEHDLTKAIDKYKHLKEKWENKHANLLTLQNDTLKQLHFKDSWIDRLAVLIGEHKDGIYELTKTNEKTVKEGNQKNLPE